MKSQSPVWWLSQGLFNSGKKIYNRPIAILTGPQSGSCGDIFPFLLSQHPMARTFGKNTMDAYGTLDLFNINYGSGWSGNFPEFACYWVEYPDSFLNHIGVEVDEPVWFEQDDVAKGEDTVVKRAIEWIQNLAHAHDVVVNKRFAQPGADSVIITAQVENPNEHQLSVTTIIRNQDSTITDQLNLFDDGLHEDGEANDNLWGNFYTPTPDNEESYKITVITDDLTDETSRTLPNVAWFTTIGPLRIDDYEIISSDTIPNHGDRIGYKLTLRNDGQTATATNVTTNLKSLDSCARIPIPERNFGDIAPGTTATHSGGVSIIFGDTLEGCSNPMTTQILVEISSDGTVFWYDTFEITVTDINEDKLALPKSYALHQNYPNPFNPTTVISYQLPVISDVELSVYNLLGQKVTTLVNEQQRAGYHHVEWDAFGIASGIYYYRIDAGEFQDVKKMVLLR